MTTFALGFIFFMSFTLLVGIGAMVLVSFDAESSASTMPETPQTTYTIRQIDTNCIETVAADGTVQRWHKAA